MKDQKFCNSSWEYVNKKEEPRIQISSSMDPDKQKKRDKRLSKKEKSLHRLSKKEKSLHRRKERDRRDNHVQCIFSEAASEQSREESKEESKESETVNTTEALVK